jgi:Tetratricopeptide repeat
MTQNNLGLVLQTLGERESATARMEEAVATFREALQEGRHSLPRRLAGMYQRARRSNGPPPRIISALRS